MEKIMKKIMKKIIKIIYIKNKKRKLMNEF